MCILCQKDLLLREIPPPSANLFEIFHPEIQTFKQAELIASINLFTEELKTVDQLKQDSCIACAVR